MKAVWLVPHLIEAIGTSMEGIYATIDWMTGTRYILYHINAWIALKANFYVLYKLGIYKNPWNRGA